tara:strand:- start:34 stop:876 length:843 start_codon:yes stop_codon:yes gene_type:complete
MNIGTFLIKDIQFFKKKASHIKIFLRVEMKKSKINFGGNIIKRIKNKIIREKLMNNNRYYYEYFKAVKKGNFHLKNINNANVIFLKKNKKSSIFIDNKSYKISNLKGLFIKKRQISLKIKNGPVSFLIAGIKQKIKNEKIVKLRKKFYKVTKPWGYELWLNGEKPTFAFKKIFIRKGHQTSLQYHKKKYETNFLYKGIANLFYTKHNNIRQTKKILSKIEFKKIVSRDVVNVRPNIVHRIKALTDISLYEVSTPHLSDVIRIADDNNRKSGKILKEHRKY